MNENTNPEVTAEDTAAAATEEKSEAESVTAENTESVAEDSAADTENISNAAENDMADNDSVTVDIEVDDLTESEEISDPATDLSEAEEGAKKKPFLQIPVIISLCIIAAALLGYFVFTGFFLREPEGVTWSNELNGATYYYQFNSDGTFVASVGSVEVNGSYQKSKDDEGNTLAVSTTIGSFYGSASATYTISGSRILGNQTLDCSYGEGYDFTLNQAKKEIVTLDLPEDFTPDEELVGTWYFKYMGYDIYKATFNKDGSMCMEFVQDGSKYNGIYTIEDSTINFTYCITENIVVPIDYTLVDHDNLTFMGYNFVREGSQAAEATPDQQIITAQE